MDDASVIIVGSGPTAAAAASRLAERKVSCLVVNEGSLVPPGLIMKLGGRTVYRLDRGHGLDCHDTGHGESARWFDTSALGGLSNYWTAATPRFDPDDFEVHGRADRRWMWPLRYDDLVPWYEAAERLLQLTGAAEPEWRGRNGCLAYTRTTPHDWQGLMRQLPFDCQMTTSAIGPPHMIARRPREHESYRTVLRPLETAGRINVAAGLRVNHIVWDHTNHCARGVLAHDVTSGEQIEFSGRHVLLCAGTIGTVSILHRSRTAQHPRGMGNTSGLLGRFVTDHPRFWCVLSPSRRFTAIDQPLQIRQPATDTHGFGWQHSLGLAPGIGERIRAWSKRPTSNFGISAFGTQLPQDKQTFVFDGDGSALRAMDFAYDPDSVDALTTSIGDLRAALGEQGIGTSVADQYLDRPGGSIHWSGGARMHSDPSLGVVDGFGRVHDAPGVSVCDASAFTTLPEKNPTLTAMALAMRAADRAADDLV